MSQHDRSADISRIIQLGAICPLRHLRMATRTLTQLYDEILKPTGLRSTQLPVLVAAAIMEPAPITQLAEAMAMDRTTLTRNLKPLENQGLLRITPGDDQRTREVTLTEAGRTMLARITPQWEEAQALVVDQLGEEWRNDLIAGLSALTALKA